MASSIFLGFLQGNFWWIGLSTIAFVLVSSGESVKGRSKTPSSAATLSGDLSRYWQSLEPQFWSESREKRQAEEGSAVSNRAVNQTFCQDSLAAYGNAAANFIGCSINNSQPILLCEKCVNVYLYAQTAFTVYTTTKDENGQNCDDVFYGKNLIEVAHRANSSIEAFWRGFNCANCFDSYYIRFSDNVIAFIDKHQNLTHCLNEYGIVTDGVMDMANLRNTSLVCKECYHYYKDLSRFFYKHYANDIAGTCMDVLAVMSQTRRLWRHWLQCENRHPSMLIPWTVVIIVFATTIVFYIGMLFNTTFKAYTIRRQDRFVTARYGAINQQNQGI